MKRAGGGHPGGGWEGREWHWCHRPLLAMKLLVLTAHWILIQYSVSMWFKTTKTCRVLWAEMTVKYPDAFALAVDCLWRLCFHLVSVVRWTKREYGASCLSDLMPYSAIWCAANRARCQASRTWSRQLAAVKQLATEHIVNAARSHRRNSFFSTDTYPSFSCFADFHVIPVDIKC